MAEAYKAAGVDVEAGYESVRLIKDHVKKTAIEGVLGGIGGFGGSVRDSGRLQKSRTSFRAQTELEQSSELRF